MSRRTDMMRAILAEHGIPLVNHGEESPAMTPKDALIEKMAREHYEWGRLRGWAATPWDHMREHHRARYVEQMRAAYEAEHEETKG